VARVVSHGHPFSVRTDYTRNRLCDGIWHCIQIRLDGCSLTMKVNQRQFNKHEGRIKPLDMRGPLFIGGYSEKYSPSYLTVRTRSFFHGRLRNLKINEQQIDWLVSRSNTTKSNICPMNLIDMKD
jgi:hypothetical protein